MFPRSLFRLRSCPRIERTVFWWHYKLTFLVLCLVSLFLVLRQCFGNPIDCFHKNVPLNGHCWSYRTYVVEKSARNVKRPYAVSEEEDRVFLKGYQYYPFILLVQALGFLLPWLLWRGLEGRLVDQLTRRINHPHLHPEVREKKLKRIVEYIHAHLRRNTFYLFFYLVCETLCLLNAVLQLVLTNYFLDGAFSGSPLSILESVLSGREDRADALSLRFSRSSFCRYKKPGSAETQVVPCTLAHNSLNELVCVSLWYWTAGLAAITAASLLYHLAETSNARLRLMTLRRRARLLDGACLEKVMLDAGIGDWFLLLLLSDNLEAVHLSDLFQCLVDEFGKFSLGNCLVFSPATQVVDHVQRSSPVV